MYDEGWDISKAGVKKAASYVDRGAALGAKTSERYRVQGLVQQFGNSYDEAVQQLELAGNSCSE